jgi:flavorubredoxin
MQPLMVHPCAEDTFTISAVDRVPGQGLLLCNAFLIRGKEPTLIDTCATAEREPFLQALRNLIDPAELRWIILTHEENDHAGNLQPLLELAPRATVVGQFQAIGKLTHEWPVPLERAFLANPGQSHTIADRTLRLVRPPLFDSPGTSAVFDTHTGLLFSADCFGAFIPEPVRRASELPPSLFNAGLAKFNRANHPWIHGVDRGWLGRTLEVVRALAPAAIASSHGPLVQAEVPAVLDLVATLPNLDPWVPPDQARLVEILRQ